MGQLDSFSVPLFLCTTAELNIRVYEETILKHRASLAEFELMKKEESFVLPHQFFP